MPQPTWIYRMTHYRNVPWMLAHGLHARNSAQQDPNYINIGNRDLIGKRNHRVVPIPPGGVLNDYVPFYFCKHSAMLYNIHTGRVEGVTATQRDVVYMVSSIEHLQKHGLQFVFTDRHAYVAGAKYCSDPAELKHLSWPLIQSRDFRRDPNDPSKVERRAAECLVYKQAPVVVLAGIVCLTDEVRLYIEQQMQGQGAALKVVVRPDWYF